MLPDEATPYVLITPLGLAAMQTLSARLQALKVAPQARAICFNWHWQSNWLRHPKPPAQPFDTDATLRAKAFACAWQSVLKMHPQLPDQALIWWLENADYQCLRQHKQALRQGLPSHTFCVRTGQQTRTLHSLHLPEPEDVVAENQRLRKILGLDQRLPL